MKMETEITVKVNCSYEKLVAKLKENGFENKEEFDCNDIYMINKDINLSKLSSLDILSKCILVRDRIGGKKELLYKYKKYDDNKDIIEQGKVECLVQNIEDAKSFMEAINYIELFRIYDHCIVYANEESELLVQIVNDKYLFIEMETNCSSIDRQYASIEELKSDINRYNLPIDTSSYFAKKGEIILKEVLNNN